MTADSCTGTFIAMCVLMACVARPSAMAGETWQPGLAYEVFGSPALGRSAEVGTVLDITAMDKGNNDWSLRFTGVLTPPADGEYVFRIEADTGVRLKVADQFVVNGWARDGARTGKATLAKGQPIALVVEYFFDRTQGGKMAALRLFWTPPGGQEAPVPAAAYTCRTPPPAPIEVMGDDQKTVNLNLPDGGLKPVVGVQNFQVLRASRNRPELADGNGWTYAHHQDLAVWKGRLYAAWAMTPQDEDVPPYKVVYATSTDGIKWSAPADLFPREHAWACRFYFYRASNGCMLAFCAGKSADGTVSEAAKKVLLVRRITAEHQLEKVFALVTPLPDQPPLFDTATDPVFVAACREAAGSNLLLEQQDYGRFLGDRRMKWHDDPVLNNVGFWKFGKALCFYHRKDGILVGLSKMGYATLSDDNGRTWSRPVQPPSLFAGSAKIWGQRTADRRFVLAYTPDPGRGKRYPLVMVHGDDGREFKDMRVIHGELPRLRYQGKYKDIGAQYMRGLAEWADDGTFADKDAMWLIYSVNKEDIWVARIPLPVKPDETAFPTDDFAKATPGAVASGWNLYSPKWAPVSVVDDQGKCCLELRDGDPFDYARAVRVFPESANVRAELELTPAQANARLEIELCDVAGRRPVRVVLTETGLLQAADGKVVADLGEYTADEKLTLVITAVAAAGRYNVQGNGAAARELAVAETDAKALQRLSLRTGVWRGLGDGGPVEPKTDNPLPVPAVFRVHALGINAP